MAAYTITLTGAAGVSTVTPLFNFAGTIDVKVDTVSIKFLTSGVEDSIALTVGQALEYVCSDWESVSVLDIRDDKVSGDISGWTLPTSLFSLNLDNTSVSGDISGWTLPTSLVTFRIRGTSVSGDISGWTLPNSLADFQINITSVSGDISGWTLPTSLVTFLVYSTSVSGDISGWTLPSSLDNFQVYNTSVSGDISGWTLPSSLAHVQVYSTSVSGDVSGWTLPNSLVTFYVDNTSVDYDASGGAFIGVTNTLGKIDFDDCSLSYSQVNNVLADLVTSGISGKALDIAGDNAAPRDDGITNAAILTADGWAISKSGLGTVSQEWHLLGITKKAIFTCTAGDTAVFPDAILSEPISGRILTLETNPGATAPSDNYDITIVNENGLDVLAGAGIDRDTSTTEAAYPTVGTYFRRPNVLSDTLTLKIAGNSVNSAVTVITIVYREMG